MGGEYRSAAVRNNAGVGPRTRPPRDTGTLPAVRGPANQRVGTRGGTPAPEALTMAEPSRWPAPEPRRSWMLMVYRQDRARRRET